MSYITQFSFHDPNADLVQGIYVFGFASDAPYVWDQRKYVIYSWEKVDRSGVISAWLSNKRCGSFTGSYCSLQHFRVRSSSLSSSPRYEPFIKHVFAIVRNCAYFMKHFKESRAWIHHEYLFYYVNISDGKCKAVNSSLRFYSRTFLLQKCWFPTNQNWAWNEAFHRVNVSHLRECNN